jgi:hypothetical protein
MLGEDVYGGMPLPLLPVAAGYQSFFSLYGSSVPAYKPKYFQAMGFLIQFSFIAAFSWMSAMAVEVGNTPEAEFMNVQFR